LNYRKLRKFELLLQEIEELKELSKHCAIVVEGKKDERALRSLGIDAEYYHATSIPTFELCEKIREKHRDVILFIDADREGRKLCKKIKSYLVEMGVRVNDRYRLSMLMKLETHQVENVYRRFIKVENSFNKNKI